MLFCIFSQEMNLMVTVLLTFCAEGDNTREAIQLTEYYNQWKQQVKK